MNVDLGEDPKKGAIDVGLGFVVAKGNLIATKQADGSYLYAFAEEQGYYENPSSYFCWNTLDPTLTNGNAGIWSDSLDPCRKINGGWHTPTKVQMEAIVNSGTTWGTYTMKDGTIKNGRYFGTTKVPSIDDQEKHIFLPATGHRYGSSYLIVNQGGHYWTSTFNNGDTSRAYHLDFRSNSCIIINNSRFYGLAVRCVLDK